MTTPFILLTPAQAGAIKGETEEGAALVPRKITAGPHAGMWALPYRVLEDEAHQLRWKTLSQKPVIDLDPGEAWPETAE